MTYKVLSNANSVLTFREEVQELFLDLLSLEDGTSRLSRNVGSELPFYAV
jgi:hypothetical protein